MQITYGKIKRRRHNKTAEIYINGAYVGEFFAATGGFWTIAGFMYDVSEKGRDAYQPTRLMVVHSDLGAKIEGGQGVSYKYHIAAK